MRVSPLHQRLIDVAAYAIGNRIDRLLLEACRAHTSSETALRDSLAGRADGLMRSLDAIVHVRGDERLERWIAMARAEGTSEGERNLMERDARRQITVWGGPDLHDYAAKLWSGMVRDFDAGRWKLFFSLLRQGVPAGDIQERLRAWEEDWGAGTGLAAPDSVSDAAAAIRQLITAEKTGIQH